MPNELPLINGTLAAPFTCYQPLYEQMFSLGAAQGPAITGLLIQDATPDPADQDKGWIKTSGGVPVYPGYVFVWHAVLGHWVSRHFVGASDPSRTIYVGTSASVATYDGGDAGAPGPASGPMWEIDTAFDGRTPTGVGVIPTSAPAASIVNPLDTTDSLGASGEYKHVLTTAEGAVGTHTHPVGLFNTGGGNADDAFFNKVTPAVGTANWTGRYITGGDGIVSAAQTTADIYTLQANDGNGVTSVGHNNMQPYVGVYFIKRTARQFYVAA